VVLVRIHVIKNGETLWHIAQTYGTTVNQIIQANGVDNPNGLVVGESLVIPAPYHQYIVQRGDTLSSIARRFGINVQEIIAANQIADPSNLAVGQVLTIPVIYHAIRSGETLWSIARRYGTTVDAIAQANQIENPSMISTGQTLKIPEATRPVIEVNAYLTRMGQGGADLIAPLTPYFTYVSPFSHKINNDGSIAPINDDLIINTAWRGRTAPFLILTNIVENFSSSHAALILRNPDLQNTIITNVLRMLKEKGYAGLNIDFEYVYPEDRENYNQFLRRMAERLRPEGYLVSTALAPKVRGDQQGLLYEAHDYPVHGQLVDFSVLMTYEWGWSGGKPWAIAPINQVRKVLDYAVTVIPRNKIMMGTPIYGRDWKIPWVQGTHAKTVSPKQAVNLAGKYGAPIQYDETYQAPFFRYTDEMGQQHEVWFEDVRSMQAKYDLVKEYKLRGLSYWVLGPSFPQNWPLLASNFTPRKR
jgi:spore germination protein